MNKLDLCLNKTNFQNYFKVLNIEINNNFTLILSNKRELFIIRFKNHKYILRKIKNLNIIILNYFKEFKNYFKINVNDSICYILDIKYLKKINFLNNSIVNGDIFHFNQNNYFSDINIGNICYICNNKNMEIINFKDLNNNDKIYQFIEFENYFTINLNQEENNIYIYNINNLKRIKFDLVKENDKIYMNFLSINFF